MLQNIDRRPRLATGERGGSSGSRWRLIEMAHRSSWQRRALAAAFLTAFASQASAIELEMPSYQIQDAAFGEWWKAAAAEFAKQNPGHSIKLIPVSFNEHHDQLTTRFVAGSPPDLAHISARFYFGYADQGFLEPLDETSLRHRLEGRRFHQRAEADEAQWPRLWTGAARLCLGPLLQRRHVRQGQGRRADHPRRLHGGRTHSSRSIAMAMAAPTSTALRWRATRAARPI